MATRMSNQYRGKPPLSLSFSHSPTLATLLDSDLFRLSDDTTYDFNGMLSNWTQLLELGFDLNDSDTTSISSIGNAEGLEYNYRVAMTVIYSLIALLSLLGNLLHCIVILRSQTLRTMTNIFMTHLSVANMLFITAFTPLLVSRFIIQQQWVFGSFLCKLSTCAGYFTGSASFFLMALVAIDRHFILLKSTRKINRIPGHLMTLFVWLLAAIIASPFFIFADAKPQIIGDGLETDPSEVRCKMEVPHKRYVMLGTVIIQFFLPLCIITPCYWRICAFLWRRNAPGADNEAGRKRVKRHQQRKWKTVIMLMSIVITFIVCYTPLCVYSIMIEFQAAIPNIQIFLACHMLGSLSVCLSPYIYLMSDSFRQELRRLCPCGLSAAAESQPTWVPPDDVGSTFVNVSSDPDHSSQMGVIRRLSLAVVRNCRSPNTQVKLLSGSKSASGGNHLQLPTEPWKTSRLRNDTICTV